MTTHTEEKPDTLESSASSGSQSGKPSWGALLVVLAGLFITNLDFFIVNVAIPSLQSGLHATAAQVQFVAAAFTVGLAAVLITGGRLGDLFGRRRIFSVGIGLFTLSSLACGIAPTMGTLIAARAIQGAAAAMVIPQVLSILTTAYTGKHRTTAFNAYGIALGAAAVFGQLIGGLLIRANLFDQSWRAVFLINVPIGIAVCALVPRLVPESRAAKRTRLDLTGTVLVTGGLVAIVWPLIQGRQDGWPTWTWECMATAVPILAAFWFYQRSLADRGKAPLVNPSLFRDRAFSVGLAVILVFFAAMASFFLVLALYLQEGRGTNALDSGLLFTPLGLGFFVSSARAPALSAKLGRQVLALGSVIMAVGDVGLAETSYHLGLAGSVTWCIPAMVVCGLGMGLVIAPLTSLVLKDIATEHAASASGVFATAQEMGNAMGIAIIGVVFFNITGHRTGNLDFPHAFSASLFTMAGISLLVTVLVHFLPRDGART